MSAALPRRCLAQLAVVLTCWAASGGAAAQAPAAASAPAKPPTKAAEAASPAPAPLLWVLRAAGGRQCEAGGTSLAEHRALLQGAGVAVSAERCASDGRMRVALCGAGDGRLNALQVPAAALPQAQKLGFQAMAAMPGAQFIDCR